MDITHERLQQEASKALRLAMKEGVAYETRQDGDEISFTTVLQKDVEGTVLAVSYPDGGIDYYPTEISLEERINRKNQEVGDEIQKLGNLFFLRQENK